MPFLEEYPGLTEKTSISFTSSNSSFSECVRKQLPLHRITGNDNPACTGKLINERCIYTGKTHYLSENVAYSFTNTDFTECKHSRSDSYGGAIDCTAGDLTIKRCSFTRCYSQFRAGAASFKSNGKCTQEDNIYSSCSSDDWTGAFDSYDTSKRPYHYLKRCKFIKNSAKNFYAHSCIEFSSEISVDSNIYIHERSTGTRYAGTVVNYHAQKSVVYSNCLFVDGEAYSSGGLSFLSYDNYPDAIFSVNFCFFSDNYDLDKNPREIYYDGHTSNKASEDCIIQSFSVTPNSIVFVLSQSPQEKYWLPQANIFANQK